MFFMISLCCKAKCQGIIKRWGITHTTLPITETLSQNCSPHPAGGKGLHSTEWNYSGFKHQTFIQQGSSPPKGHLPFVAEFLSINMSRPSAKTGKPSAIAQSQLQLQGLHVGAQQCILCAGMAKGMKECQLRFHPS